MFRVKQFSLNLSIGFHISMERFPLRGNRGCIHDAPNLRASKTPAIKKRNILFIVNCKIKSQHK